MGVLFLPMLVMGIVMFFISPDLLTKRIKNKEDRTTQKSVVALSGLLFIVSFLVAAFNDRYHWHTLPTSLPYIASIIFLIGYSIYAEVMRENAWLSRTIEVQNGQSVVSTGLYGIVRHPMYTATILMFLAIPLVLGSLIAFCIMLLYIPIIIRRINDEEQLLKAQLNGYTEYCTQVRWRLIPYIY
jgi:protein-S-isoprenylcysteine O-methyltransferase Ste14